MEGTVFSSSEFPVLLSGKLFSLFSLTKVPNGRVFVGDVPRLEITGGKNVLTWPYQKICTENATKSPTLLFFSFPNCSVAETPPNFSISPG